jgi:hypothetical protein
MATTRIKDLSKTATTVNSDANLVLDGNTGGTQKISRDNFRQDTADAFVAAPGTYNLAPLNSGTGKIDAVYLSSTSDSPKGAWNASTNTPTLADGSGTAGDYYDVTVAGSSDLGSGSIAFTVGDVVKYNGTVWFKIDSVANILDGVSTIDGAKAAIEIPDVGTAPNEVPLNGMLGDMAYQSSEGISVARAEVESTTGTGSTQALTVTDGTDTNFIVQEDGKAVTKSNFKADAVSYYTEYAANYLRATGGTYYIDNYEVGGETKFRVSSVASMDTTAVTLDSSGNTTLNTGNLVIGTSGKGIDFGSAASGSGTPITNGGLLDDYESGTFTPTDGSGAGLTFTGAEGTYIKVGGQVTCWVKLTYPTTANTTAASVQGFPFPFSGNGVERVGGPVVLTDYGEYISALGVNSVSKVQFFKTAGYGPTNASLSGKFVWFYVTYNIS